MDERGVQSQPSRCPVAGTSGGPPPDPGNACENCGERRHPDDAEEERQEPASRCVLTTPEGGDRRRIVPGREPPAAERGAAFVGLTSHPDTERADRLPVAGDNGAETHCGGERYDEVRSIRRRKPSLLALRVTDKVWHGLPAGTAPPRPARLSQSPPLSLQPHDLVERHNT